MIVHQSNNQGYLIANQIGRSAGEKLAGLQQAVSSKPLSKGENLKNLGEHLNVTKQFYSPQDANFSPLTSSDTDVKNLKTQDNSQPSSASSLKNKESLSTEAAGIKSGEAGNIQSGTSHQNENLMTELGKNPKAMEAYNNLSPQEKESFNSLTSSRSYGTFIKDKLRNDFANNKNPAIKKMFNEAPPENQEKLLNNIGNQFFKRAVDMTEPGSPPKIYPEFMVKLLENGKLGDKDSQGNSLLKNLHTMQNQKFADGLDGKEMFESTCRNITNSDFIHQGNKGTCSVTTVEYIQAKNNPSEFVRLASGLSDEKGEVKLRNGDILKRPEGLLEDDGSERTPVDRLYQASMMQYGKGSKSVTYDNEKNRFYTKLGPLKINVGEGISDKELKKVMDATFSYESNQKNYNGNIKETEKELSDGLSSGKLIPLCLKWEGNNGKHEVTLEKMDENFVYVRNPHGNLEDISEKDSKSIKREAVHDNDPELSGGHVKIAKEEFYKRLVDYAIPLEK